MLVGQRAQTLADELPGGDEDGRLAPVAAAGAAGGGDVVADVGVGGEPVQRGARAIPGEGELADAGPVAQHDEDDPAEVAHEHHPAGDGHLVALADLGQGVGARRDPDRVRIGAAGDEPVQRAVPDPDLLGQTRVRLRGPRPVLRVEAEDRERRQPFGRGGPGGAPRVPLSPEFAQRRYGDEALGDRGGEADTGEGDGVAVADEAGVPLGVVLGVGAVQGLQLPPPGQEQQQPPPEPEDGAGADAGALLEHGPEDGEVEGDPTDTQLGGGRAEFGDHELHDAVGGGGAVAAHQVEGDAVAAPGHEGQQGQQPAVRVEGLHQQAVAVGGVAEPVQGHGEAAFGLGVAPGVGPGDDLLDLLVGEGAVAPDAAGGAGAPDAAYGLAGDAHVAAVEVEAGGVQDRLVAELERAEAGPGEGGGAVLGGAHRRGRPGVPAGHVQPGGDGVRPRLPVAHRVAAGQAHAGLHAVGDGGLAAGREDDGLVPAGGEVAEGVLVAVGPEQGADAGFLVAVQGRLHAL